MQWSFAKHYYNKKKLFGFYSFCLNKVKNQFQLLIFSFLHFHLISTVFSFCQAILRAQQILPTIVHVVLDYIYFSYNFFLFYFLDAFTISFPDFFIKQRVDHLEILDITAFSNDTQLNKSPFLKILQVKISNAKQKYSIPMEVPLHLCNNFNCKNATCYLCCIMYFIDF